MWGPRPYAFSPESQGETVEVLKTHQFFQQDFLVPFCVWTSRGRGDAGERRRPGPCPPARMSCLPSLRQELTGPGGRVWPVRETGTG